MLRIGARRHQDSNEDPGLVAVAIDSDKSSQHALKWTADHLVSKGQLFILLHVRRKALSIPTPTGKQLSISEVNEDVATAFLEQIDLQTKELLLPFQCFCNRRGLRCKEVILDDLDVPKAIINYIMHESVDKLVLGASGRNAFSRTFKGADVPTCVSKAAPDFCSVYVISKGRISSVRPAPHPNKDPVERRSSHKFESRGKFQSTKSDPSGGHLPIESVYLEQSSEIRKPPVRSIRIGQVNEGGYSTRNYDSKIAERIHRVSKGEGHLDFSYQSIASCPSPSRSSTSSTDRQVNYAQRDYVNLGGPLPRFSNVRTDHPDEQMRSFESNRSSLESNRNSYESNKSGEQMSSLESNRSGGQLRYSETNRSSMLDWSGASNGYEHQPPVLQEGVKSSCSPSSLEDAEVEVRRLRRELQQTMGMYNNACKDALSAQQKTRDLESWVLEEEKKIEGSKFAKETALQMAEKEKERYKAALEAAETAQRLAEFETRKRFSAEKKLLQEEEKRKVLDTLAVDVRYRRYSIEDIKEATDDFSEDLKIGEGGYGPVFKSTLDHTLVAIKILRPDTAQGMKQFQQEVEVLSCIRHPNMVLLMGACPEYGCLVYEYMANGSLEDRLFCRNNTPPLSWQLRFKIASEIATGLLFLHQTKPEPLVHRDLKPANILLDHNFVSKIADVGLARLVPPSVANAMTQYRMTAAAGTFCYIDPEYQKTGLLGIKSDIYALGIILLQLITGKPPMGLAHYVEGAMEMGELEEMLDPMVPDWPKEETAEFANLALKCAELRRKDRPDLGKVVLPVLNQLRDFAYESV